MSQQGGSLLADQVQHQATAVLCRHGPQPVGERRLLYGRLLGRAGGSLPRLMGVGQFAEQRVRSARRVLPGGQIPPHVRHGERGLVVLECLLQGQERQSGVHGADAAACEALFLCGAEASPVPVAPLDRDGCQALCTAVVGEGVEEGVGRGVVPLTGAAEKAGDGGEEHERGEVEVTGEFVQVRRGPGLRVQCTVEPTDTQRVEQAVVQQRRAVDDCGQGQFRRDRVEQGSKRGPVARVTGGERDLAAQRGELGCQVFGAGGFGTASADEQQVFGALLREPARGVGAQRAGAARDEHGAPGAAPLVGSGGTGRPGCGDEPASVHTCCTDRQLVLLQVTRRESGAESVRRTPVQVRREVEQAAPALRAFGTDDAAQSPEQGLGRGGHVVRSAHGDRATGRDPQRSLHGGVREGLYEGHRVREPGRHGFRLGVGACVQGEERQDSGDGGVRSVVERCAYEGGQRFAIAAGCHTDRDDVGGGERVEALFEIGVGCGRVGSGGRGQRHQERARRPMGSGPFRDPLPHHAVAPGVDGGQSGALPSPRGQCGQCRCERLLRVDREGPCECRQVRAVDGGPEGVVFRGGPGPVRVRRAGQLKPVAPVLERVRGQVHTPGAGAGEHGPPVRFHTVRVGGGERGHEPAGFVLAPPQGAERDRIAVRRVEDLLESRREHGVWADLDEHCVAVGQSGGGRRLELHHGAQVAVPVVRVQAGGVDETARQRGVERNRRGAWREPAQRIRQLRTDAFDLRRVGRVVHRDAPGPHFLCRACGHEGVQCVQVTRHDDGGGSVHRGHRQPGAELPHLLAHPLDRARDRHHPALAGEGHRDFTPSRHEACRVRKGEGSGDGGCGDLALGVADHSGRLDSARAPQLGQGDHDRPEHQLHDVSPVRRGSALHTSHHIEEGPVRVGRQRLTAFCEPCREDGGRLHQARRHPGPLRTLPREHEDGLDPAGRGPPYGTGGRADVRQGPERGQEAVVVFRHQGDTVFERGPGGGERPPDVRRGRAAAVACLQVGQQTGGLGRDRLRRLPGQHPRCGAGGEQGPCVGSGRIRRTGVRAAVEGDVFEDHVRVGATDPERRHPRPAWLARLGPGHLLGQQLDATGRPVDVP